MESHPATKKSKSIDTDGGVKTTADVQHTLGADTKSQAIQWLLIASFVYLLLIAVSLIGSGFKASAGDTAKELFAFASNPITALVIGTLCTALIQSSSTVTSIIVGLVAGGLPISIAIPMVMGANIGTTITNTAVSLGHIKHSREFQRAFAAATIHDFFNILSVIIFLPLEIAFNIFDKIGVFLASLLVGGGSMSIKSLNPVKPLVNPPVKFIQETILGGLPSIAAGIIMIILGIAAIFIAIALMNKSLKVLMAGRAKKILHHTIGKDPKLGILSGTVITILVQSSSTTTSLIVPLAGNGIFTLRQIYPFTLGANIGTCVTALLAATAVMGDNAVFALEIALIHLLHNLIGVIVIYGTPFLRELPIKCAEHLSDLAVKNKLVAASYLLLLFFLIPALLIGISEIIWLTEH